MQNGVKTGLSFVFRLASENRRFGLLIWRGNRLRNQRKWRSERVPKNDSVPNTFFWDFRRILEARAALRGLPNGEKSASWSLLGRPRGLPVRVPDTSEPHFRFVTTSGPQNGRLGTPKLAILPPPRRRFGRFSPPQSFFSKTSEASSGLLAPLVCLLLWSACSSGPLSPLVPPTPARPGDA